MKETQQGRRTWVSCCFNEHSSGGEREEGGEGEGIFQAAGGPRPRKVREIYQVYIFAVPILVFFSLSFNARVVGPILL